MVFTIQYLRYDDEKKAATLSWTRTIEKKEEVNFNACYKSGTIKILWFNVNKILQN
jgi:hypothetical protein